LHTGHWAAINWFVLSGAGARTSVYAGSMIEWTADPSGRWHLRTKWDDLMKLLGRGS
jgi:3-mercaptopyruvate sulfurtransferase SseA